MKRRFKFLRSCMALLLVMCMVLGCGSSVVAYAAEAVSKDTLNYVSLGDSMTNGYGLTGYNGNSGVLDYGYGSYTNQFATWLEENGYANEVNHFQLALSAMRAEDLHWLLEVDYDDSEVISLINEMDYNYRHNKNATIDAAIADGRLDADYAAALREESSKKAYFEAYADRWNEVFSNGDSWTWRELVHDYRFTVIANYINYYAAGNTETDINLKSEWSGYNDDMSDVDALKIVAKYFQDAVANADIVSNGIGNGNFGVFILGRIEEAIGFGGKPVETLTYKVENAIQECDPQIQALILELKDELYAKLAEYVDVTDPMMNALVNSMVYGGLSYVLNWCGSLDAIVKLNPDAEVIVVALMNTMNGIKMEMGGVTIDIGEWMGIMLDTLNAYMAGYPTVMQLLGHYEDATFYYAEERQVECYADTYNDTIYDADAIVRDRFVNSIVGEDGDELIWNSIRPIAKSMGTELQTITLAQIQAYEKLSDVEKIGYAQADGKTAMSIALYLAAEKAVLQVLRDGGTMSADAAVKMGDGSLSTDSVVALFEEKLAAYTPKNTQRVIDAIGAETFAALSESQQGMLVALFAMPDALGEALAEDKDIGGLLNLYAHCLLGNGLSGHPSQGGHDQLAAAVIEAYEIGYTAADKTLDNLTWAANTLYDLVLEYYDEAYAYAYAYAKDAGYIDTLTQGIAEAQAYLNTLAAQLTELDMTPEFAAQLSEQLASINSTLTAAYNLISTADMLDQETYDAAMALLQQAEKAVEDLVELAKQAGEDVVELVVIPALEEAYAKLLNEVLPAAEEAAREICEAAYDYLYNQVGPELQEALDALVDALEEKAQEVYPEIADMVYDYLYENPEKIIALISEYGDDAVEFLSQYVDEAMAVVAYIAANYGCDIAEAVLDNADTILTAMVDWVNTHGENAWALIRVYLEELGLMDLLPTEAEINEAIAMVEAIIADCYGQLEGATDQMLEQLEALLPVLEQQIAQLEELVENYAQLLDEQVKAQLEAALAELEAALTELEKAADELKAAVEDQLDELIPQLEAAYEAALADFEAALEDLKDNIDGAVATVRDAIENLYDILDDYRDAAAGLAAGAVDLLNEALEQLEAILAEHADEIGAQVLPELLEAVDQIAEMLDELDELIRSSADATVEEFTAQLKAILAQLEDEVENLVGIAQGQVDQVVSEAIAAFELAYLNATTDEYSITKDSYYVAIGDATLKPDGSYADLLAEKLEIEYTKIYEDDLTPAGVLALLQKSEEAQAQVAKADLVTLGFSNNTLVDFMFENVNKLSLGGTIDLDWSIFGIDGLDQQVAAALEELEAALEEKLQNAQYSAMLRVAVESYVYAYASHMMSYPMLAEAIHKISPDALVIMVGMSNAFEDVVLTYNGEEIELGDYVQYLVDAANIEALVYAMLTGNAIYVEAPDVETLLDTDDDLTLSGDLIMKFYSLLNSTTRDMLDPSDKGHEYIKDQILGALDVEDTRGLWGDANSDGVVNARDVMRILQYIAGDITSEDLDIAVCDVNGDGAINARDVMLILRYIGQDIEKFPVEK